MDTEAVLAWIDTLVLTRTGQRLSDLQRTILRKVWQGKKYLEIAASYGCTEGHVKDVSADLWKFLSQQLGEKITKTNCRLTLTQHIQSTPHPAAPPPSAALLTPHFVGRGEAIAHLNTLVQSGAKVIVIQGEGGLGKTTLAQQYLYTQGFELVLELLMAKETPNITAAERVVEEWLKQDLQQEPGMEFGVTLGRLKRQLHHRRIGVLIDNLEPALDQQGRLIAPHRNYVELFRVLADLRVQSVTLMTSRDRLCESSLNVVHYRLPGLSLGAWQQFFQHRGLGVDALTLQAMHQAYGGNAKAMEILCGTVQEDFEGDWQAYWHEHQGDLLVPMDLKDLVASQVNRLQQIDPQAYRLFCRLGCYRYQDISRVPLPGLVRLLWDVPAEQHRPIIASLRHRSLVECHNGGYWLHPVIRAEAIARLRLSDEWETANRQAAEFWTTSVQAIATTKDALQALEAYYHYVEIQDYESAGRVILKSRHNQWQQFLPLGSTLYRMGLLQPVLNAIMQVIDRVQSKHPLSELYNILGDLQWISGNIHEAIACQEKTIELASQSLASLTDQNKHAIYYFKMLEVDSLLSIGLYKVDLWELAAAAELFQHVIDRSENTAHHSWAGKASVCLALVQSYLKQVDARNLAIALYNSFVQEQPSEQTGRFAYFIQMLGQTFANLTDFERASELYEKALISAEAGHYTQIKAKTLTGLAEIQRHYQHFERALTYHQEAIALLDQMGAKCDLAIAHFQLGLTHRAMKHPDESAIHFSQAIQIATDMKAPKQVERFLSIR